MIGIGKRFSLAKEFDVEKSKKFLKEREEKEREKRELERKKLLQKVIKILKDELKESGAEVFLVGSILKPFSFSEHSDVDIVLKGYKDDRFDLWPKLEKKIGRSIEIIPFESCHFKELILKEGLRVF